jgi:hypothetical protein
MKSMGSRGRVRWKVFSEEPTKINLWPITHSKEWWNDGPLFFERISVMDKRKELMEACKKIYRWYGYIIEKDFPGEYYFMYNPTTGEKVRLYYNGQVSEYRD